MKMNLGHAHKAKFWYLLEALFKISNLYPCHFCMGVLSTQVFQDHSPSQDCPNLDNQTRVDK